MEHLDKRDGAVGLDRLASGTDAAQLQLTFSFPAQTKPALPTPLLSGRLAVLLPLRKLESLFVTPGRFEFRLSPVRSLQSGPERGVTSLGPLSVLLG